LLTNILGERFCAICHIRDLGESIQAICRQVAKDYRDVHSWLFAVPLVHFLTQESQPFNASVLLTEKPRDKDDTWWGAGGFETKAVREKTVTDDGCPSHMIETLHPLFDLDPLFKRTFLLVIPCRAFGRLAASEIFSSLEMCTTLARLVQEMTYVSQKEFDAISNTFKKVKKDFQVYKQGEHLGSSTDDVTTSNQEALLCANSCLTVLKKVLFQLERGSTLFYDCLDAVEMCTAVLRTETDGNGRKCESPNSRKIAEDVIRLVKEWLKKALQDNIPCYSESAKHDELEVWTKLFGLHWTDNECNEMWKNHLMETLKQRLEEVGHNWQGTRQRNCFERESKVS